MRSVIICESMFGNTDLLAAAVEQGLGSAGGEADLVEVGAAYAQGRHFAGCDLLVVAAPTHALTLSRPESRAEAVARGADPRREPIGVREWLGTLEDVLPASRPRPLVAVFDTRVLKAKHWPGSAAHRAARTLRKAGFTVLDRRSFYVEGIAGPLLPGEVERAGAWGRRLAGLAAARASSNGETNGNSNGAETGC